MVFCSAPFLYVFLPGVMAGYYIISRFCRNVKVKNIFLIVCSLLFYAYGEPVFVFVMAVSVAVNYLLAGLIIKYSEKRHMISKIFVICAVILDIGLIGVFKYLDFFLGTFCFLFRTKNVIQTGIDLPVGISFFTFQILSYVIDVYRDPKEGDSSFTEVLLYISFFPQLIAGPIVKFHDVRKYLKKRDVDDTEILNGIMRFTTGLFKKLFIANSCGEICDSVYGNHGFIGAGTAWTAAVCYALQIYFDFSGYSDMAIGMGHMFGFTFQENFDHPYISTSIREFWHRWHISLSTWFKEYVYIPLGGNRKGRVRTEINKLIVFALTGLWHGAAWNYVIWGMIHGISICAEDIFRGKKEIKNIFLKFICRIYTLFIVVVGFVFFRAETLGKASNIVKSMFGFGKAAVQAQTGLSAFNSLAASLTPFNTVMAAVGIIMSVPLPEKLSARMKSPDHDNDVKMHTGVTCLKAAGTMILLFLCMAHLAGNGFNPFIYFKF